MLNIISQLSASCVLIFLSDFSDWRIVHPSSLLERYYFVLAYTSPRCFVVL